MTKPIPRAAFGRPPKGTERRRSVSYRFPPATTDKLSRLAKDRGTTRTGILEILIDQAAEHLPKTDQNQ